MSTATGLAQPLPLLGLTGPESPHDEEGSRVRPGFPGFPRLRDTAIRYSERMAIVGRKTKDIIQTALDGIALARPPDFVT
jgi:hypothetical protein